MALITPEYQELFFNYNHSNYTQQFGHRHYKRVLNFAKYLKATSILDYGCGEGLLKREFHIHNTLRDYVYNEFDPCIHEKNKKRPDKADLVTLIHVLEYVEPEKLNKVAWEAYNRCLKGLYIVVGTKDDGNYLAPETRAMRTEQNAVWWINKLNSLKLPIENVSTINDESVMLWIERR